MQIHLSKYDIILIRDKAVEGAEAGDGGEAFCEEAIGCFEDADIETIESRAGGTADDFMLELFELWDGTDPMELIEMLVESLANLDIELTFDDIDIEDDDDDFDEEDDEWDGEDDSSDDQGEEAHQVYAEDA